ncbi:MAG TPA: DNA translocase FtsK 4TM domain-containing protein, partial [Kofleriaceae bacterium]|nr:DNA translocase FtsK 4TM domain-containing protein [Kofleriaceae bacterium]
MGDDGGWVRRRLLELLGIGLLVAGGALALALWGHDPNDPSLNHATSTLSGNPLGHFGASLADVSMQTIGRASWIVALVLALWGVRLILNRPLRWPWLPVVALPLALLAATAYLATWPLSDQWPYWVGFGGYVGDFLLHRLERPIGPEIYPLVTGVASLILVVLAAGVTWREAWQGSRAAATASGRLLRRREAEPEPRWAQAVDQRLGARARPGAVIRPPDEQRPGLFRRLLGGLGAGLRRRREAERAKPAPRPMRPVAPATASEPVARDTGPVPQAAPRRAAARPAQAGAGANAAAPATPGDGELVPDGRFKLPPLKFLTQPRQRRDVSLDRSSLAETAKALERALDDFGVRGEIIDVRPGPVVTLYELEPAPGTRAARV